MKVLVTGGAGFIGSHLCERLLKEGHWVAAYDDLSTSKKSNLSAILKHPRFRFIKDTVLNEKRVKFLIRQSDVVFHLASAVGVKYVVDHPVESIETIINGTQHILKWASHYGKKLLITSSSEVYGQPPAVPVKEDSRTVIGPTSILRWSYAGAKAMDEFLALAYARSKNLKVIIVRLFNTVGPRQTGIYGMVFPRFIEAALQGKTIKVYGTGRQSRTFTYVDDVIWAMIQLIKKNAAYGNVYNIGNNAKPVRIHDLAKRVKKRLSSRSKIILEPYHRFYGDQFEDINCRIPNIVKLQKMIGYKPRFNLDQMIDATAASFRRGRGR